MSIIQLVYTEKDKCRICYTCVRECPAKAIRISNGQAEIILERCIACGNCVKVCSQNAKKYLRYEEQVINLLNSNYRVVACIAPSFPAEFDDFDDYRMVVGMMKAAGFYKVTEVGFGADLVALQQKKLIENTPCQQTIISSDCPAIVNYVIQYQPKLTKNLAPIISPMVAMNRVVKLKYGEDIKVVFVGPCIAKKYETNELDYIITFSELRNILKKLNIKTENTTPSDFDPPLAGGGSIFPISRGMLQTMDKNEKIGENDIVAADGHKHFTEALSELADGSLKTHYLELLCCEGCIMGAGMSKKGKRFARRSKVKEYVNHKIKTYDRKQWKKDMDFFMQKIDFSRSFQVKDRRFKLPSKNEIIEVLHKLGKYSQKDYLNCGACGYNTCIEYAIAVKVGLAEEEMCLPYSIEKLHKTIADLNITNEKLASAKLALKQSEKLASMGQLSAGIAHELNNPLGVITMYSNIIKEEVDRDSQIYEDLQLIVEQAERCKKIVSGLLNFARKNQVKLLKTDIEKFVKHSTETIIVPDNIKIQIINKTNEKFFNVDYDQMMQVFNNLEKNAIEAMPEGGKLTITLEDNDLYHIVKFEDTGTGISEENLEKIFTPFFTTKPVGEGTGLGLPLVYGIIKMHKGKIEVKSNNDKSRGNTGTTFTVYIPKNLKS